MAVMARKAAKGMMARMEVGNRLRDTNMALTMIKATSASQIATKPIGAR